MPVYVESTSESPGALRFTSTCASGGEYDDITIFYLSDEL
jgi:hypothetical protein